MPRKLYRLGSSKDNWPRSGQAGPGTHQNCTLKKLQNSLGLLLPWYPGGKFLLTVNWVRRQQDYFKNAHKGRKIMWGEHHLKNLVIRPEITYSPYNGALLIKLQISNAMVGRILIHNGSEGNILFAGATTRMCVLEKVNFRRSTFQTFNATLLNTMKQYSTRYMQNCLNIWWPSMWWITHPLTMLS